MPFSHTINTASLSKGLRPSKRMPRNSGFLVECVGAVGQDGVLQAIEALTRMNTAAITDAFPYPQVFVFNRVIIVCGKTKIYEWVSNTLVEKITVAEGSTWRAVDGFDFVWLTNNEVSVTRDPKTFTYVESSTLPVAGAMFNFNGQIMIGDPTEAVYDD